ncbi:hypothetical protein ACIQVR_39355 [Streptomyces xanthochromogenes]|uniref:hypothetical protein n=1 Tax=Streptomyces xanthochromogenes TaxID=67384 RepID=UPI0037F9238F
MSSTLREPAPGQWGPEASAYQAAMSVVALHIAGAFIQSGSEEVHQWARELAHELKRECFDISPEIGSHLMRMTLHWPALTRGDIPF